MAFALNTVSSSLFAPILSGGGLCRVSKESPQLFAARCIEGPAAAHGGSIRHVLRTGLLAMNGFWTARDERVLYGAAK